MKKYIAVIISVIIMLLILCSCKIAKCDICGKKGQVEEVMFLGKVRNICSECNK